MLESFPRIAIVGASGAVGREALSILIQCGVVAERIALFGSARSTGSSVSAGDVTLSVNAMKYDIVAGYDLALFCADAETARTYAPTLAAAGVLVIDNSSAFRMAPDVPLIIPEVNGDLLNTDPLPRLIANPNCSTIMLLAALEPLRRRFGVSGITVSTYQAVSGAGAAGIDALYKQTRAALDGTRVPIQVFPEPCAFNVFPHESDIEPATGFNGEERKMIAETRRIWQLPHLRVLPTCVRVPVERAHAQSIIVDLETETTLTEVRQALASSEALALSGEDAASVPTPLKAAGNDRVLVGRIRFDPQGNGRRLLLWICCDQLRKGAALNAIQIAQLCCQVNATDV